MQKEIYIQVEKEKRKPAINEQNMVWLDANWGDILRVEMMTNKKGNLEALV